MLSAEMVWDPRSHGGTFLVLSCHSVEVRGSFPRVEILTFRGYVLLSCDIPLARAIAVSPWLGGQVYLCTDLGLLVLVFCFCRAGCWVVGCQVTGCRIVLVIGFRSVWGSIRPGRAQSSTQAPHPPRRCTKPYTGRVKHRHSDWSLERKEVVSRKGLDGQMGGRVLTCQWGYLKQNTASRRQRTGEKVEVGSGSSERKSGHETNSCGELRVRW